ncbi:MAG: hypothetical protein KJ956_10270 [Actinobacteria bacterium]|nr:hypothetical protein [Actinomycetota bacterium]
MCRPAGESTSEGECSINAGASHPYSFTTTWTFAISGTSDGEQLEPIVTPNPGSVSTSENPGTESSAECVGFARDFAATPAQASFGEQAPAEIVVPVGGGTTQIDQGPAFTVDIEIRPVADDH